MYYEHFEHVENTQAFSRSFPQFFPFLVLHYNDISVLSTHCIPHLWSPYIYCEVKDGCLSLGFEHSQFYSHLVLGTVMFQSIQE